MNKIVTSALAGVTALASVLSATPAAAQRWRDSDRDGRPDRSEWNRDRDRDGRLDQWDRHDNRRDRNHRWRSWGSNYGYNGYRGRWRTGQRFNHWNDRRYYVDNWRAYNLPPPRRGYRYYRDDNGDIIMAAIGSGIIGLILGSALND
jgi:Ni/Co efflux regulator RcnB